MDGTLALPIKYDYLVYRKKNYRKRDSESIALVGIDGKRGILDGDLNELIPIKYEMANIFAIRDKPNQNPYGQIKIQDYLVKRNGKLGICLLYTSPSPRDATLSRMPSSA